MPTNLETLVEKQVEMLNEGKVLEALEEFYAEDCQMYDNDVLFSQNKVESIQKQEKFIKPCTAIEGKISKHIIIDDSISVLENQTSFTHPEYGVNKINGLHIQHWADGLIVKEHYYRDEMLKRKSALWFEEAGGKPPSRFSR